LKVLIHSNSPLVGSGYGVQTDLVSNWLADHGHDVVVSAFHGHRGTPLRLRENLRLLPSGQEMWGNDVLVKHYDRERPDVLFALMDAWVLDPRILKATPLALWAPVDHTPIPPQVVDRLRYVKFPIAMSRHGEQEMRKAMFDPYYVPHMVNTQQYAPIDRTEARAAWGIPDGAYFVTTVAANKGYPPRKNLDRLLKAWAFFVAEHPGSVLYLHTNPYTSTGGPDLTAICEFYGLPYHIGSLKPGQTLKGYAVAFPDMYMMDRGEYSTFTLNALYNAADLFLLPSAGEGFGIPALEAQAAGCPVALSDYTAQAELAEAGYRIPIDDMDDRLITLQYSEQAFPKVSEIVKAMRWGYEHRGNAEHRARARAFAAFYDTDRVMTRYMMPVFEAVAAGTRDYMQFQEWRKWEKAA
jgi:glycosyltransferase involved in cell wall biosynthesis